MPNLASCINDVFDPDNTTASSGTTPVKPTLGTLLDPDDYDPELLTYSINYSKFYNAAYHHRGR